MMQLSRSPAQRSALRRTAGPYIYGTFAATGAFIAQKRFVHPVLRDARRIGPAGPLVPIRLIAETTSARSLAGQLILVTLALLASGLAAYVAAYLSRLLDDELLLTLDVFFGLCLRVRHRS